MRSRSRRWTGAAGLLLLVACAQMDPPPGGPEDRTPPTVVVTRPDSQAVVPGWRDPVVIEFSERISEQQAEEAVMVSPRTSPVVVDRGSRSLRVSLRRGWEPGQIYHVTVRPVLQDLFNNRVREPVQLVFSTGPEIPATRLTGTVVDRISGEAEVDARVEAIRRTDSLVYAVPSDSAGRFIFAHIPEGDYLLRAFPDQNRNRSLDVFEARDSVQVAVAVMDTVAAELSIVAADSTAPELQEASVVEGRRVELRFDDYLDPAQPLDSSRVVITGADGQVVPIARVTVGTPPEAQADTAAAARRPAREPVGPLPQRTLVAELSEGVELVPEGEYSVTATGIRNVVGLVADVEGEFTAPEAPADPPPEEPPVVEPGAAPQVPPAGVGGAVPEPVQRP